MTSESKLRSLLRDVAEGKVTPQEAENQLKAHYVTGYADLLHTKLDLHRQYRRNMPEAIYGANKTAEQLLEYVQRLRQENQTILCTRVSPEKAEYVQAHFPELNYHPTARVLYKIAGRLSRRGCIAVLSAGTSDQPVAEEAALCAEVLGNRVERVYDVGVAGLHRLVYAASEVLQLARVIIVVAGMEGALPSVVAGLVDKPVIAVPTSIGYGASLHGFAALLGMLNSCSAGVGVVNIDNGFGAATLAHLINNLPPVGRGRTRR